MHTEPDSQDAALDARLARLPQWQPKADFAARLAAAAARQAAQPVAAPPTPQKWLRGALRRHLRLLLGAGVLALGLALLPWSAVAGNPALPWVVAGGAAAVGLVLTLRLLRAP
jgi:hypothetical protein